MNCSSRRGRKFQPKRISKQAEKKVSFSKEEKKALRQAYSLKKEGKRSRIRAPKIQRLITAERIRRKAKEKAEKKNRWQRAKEAAKKYDTLLNKIMHEKHLAAQKLREATKSS